MTGPDWQAGPAVSTIIWDEGFRPDAPVGADCTQLTLGSCHVPLVIASPNTHAVKDPTLYTTYSLLRTAEEIFGVPLLLKAATAPSLRPKLPPLGSRQLTSVAVELLDVLTGAPAGFLPAMIMARTSSFVTSTLVPRVDEATLRRVTLMRSERSKRATWMSWLEDADAVRLQLRDEFPHLHRVGRPSAAVARP